MMFLARALIPSVWIGSLRASRHWAVQEPLVDLHIHYQGAKGQTLPLRGRCGVLLPLNRLLREQVVFENWPCNSQLCYWTCTVQLLSFSLKWPVPNRDVSLRAYTITVKQHRMLAVTPVWINAVFQYSYFCLRVVSPTSSSSASGKAAELSSVLSSEGLREGIFAKGFLHPYLNPYFNVSRAYFSSATHCFDASFCLFVCSALS